VSTTQAPLHVGDIEVRTICEGWAPLPLWDEAPGQDVDWAAQRAAYPWAFPGTDGWAWHVHAFLLRTPAGDVLVDTGTGPFGPWAPWTESAGPDAWAVSDPTSVRHVVLTHLHADHAGGAVLANGTPRFPNARYHAHVADWEHFETGPVIRRPDGLRYDARAAMQDLVTEGALSLGPDDHDVSPGVRVIHSPGHTPGHRSVLVTSGDHSLLLTGDLLHTPVQVAHPDWRSNHDVDAVTGSASRVALLGRAREHDWLVGVSHFARPFGRVSPDGWSSGVEDRPSQDM